MARFKQQLQSTQQLLTTMQEARHRAEEETKSLRAELNSMYRKAVDSDAAPSR